MKITICMYHYVREPNHSRYPGIKGLSTDLFRQQIQYVKKHYNAIDAYQLMDAVQSGRGLPRNPILLTFDDGYIDHFNTVFPILDREGLPGCFFPPARCILESCVLDVNKIHFILAAVPDPGLLVREIFSYLAEHRSDYELKPDEEYWRDCAHPSRFDPAEIVFVKRMLQRNLPEDLRGFITDALFRRFVAVDEAAFSKELYMSLDQLSCLSRNGMYVGSHGYSHAWLNTVPEEAQEKDIVLSLEFLRAAGSDTERWIMCYPFGAYNETLISILRDHKCAVALTSEVGIAQLTGNNAFNLPRLDTNDLPKDSQAEPNAWTRMAIADQ